MKKGMMKKGRGLENVRWEKKLKRGQERNSGRTKKRDRELPSGGKLLKNERTEDMKIQGRNLKKKEREKRETNRNRKG